MNQGARDANADSARRAAQSTQDKILEELRMLNETLGEILKTLRQPPQHLWPHQ